MRELRARDVLEMIAKNGKSQPQISRGQAH
jgi:hypothetical protein